MKLAIAFLVAHVVTVLSMPSEVPSTSGADETMSEAGGGVEMMANRTDVANTDDVMNLVNADESMNLTSTDGAMNLTNTDMTPNTNMIKSRMAEKRATNLGDLTPAVRARWRNQLGRRGQCVIQWNDETGCDGEIYVGGHCTTMHVDVVYKKVCGGAWAKQCYFDGNYIAAFVWNLNYQLSVVLVKRSRLPVTTGGRYSCLYGMRLSDNYRGDFSCRDLLATYSSWIYRLPTTWC